MQNKKFSHLLNALFSLIDFFFFSLFYKVLVTGLGHFKGKDARLYGPNSQVLLQLILRFSVSTAENTDTQNLTHIVKDAVSSEKPTCLGQKFGIC